MQQLKQNDTDKTAITSNGVLRIVKFFMALIGAMIMFCICFLPLLIIALYALIHLFIFGTDFTNTKFVQKIIASLNWVDKYLSGIIANGGR